MDLARYNNSWYNPGRPKPVIALWYLVNILFFNNNFFPLYAAKRLILRVFGAKLGKGVLIKPSVNIKYPWRLHIGNHVWIGEGVWIDNLATVQIGDNVCLSQGAMLLTGNHNYKLPTFDLMTGPIILEDGVWIGAKSIVCPGVRAKSHAVLTVASVAVEDLEPFGIYQGNPAVLIRKRRLIPPTE